MTCTLYRHFDASGQLLYVGIAKDAMRRTDQHVAKSHWGQQIASVRLEHFADRTDAVAAERAAILSEAPLHNIQRTEAMVPIAPTSGWRGQMLDAIKSRGETMRAVSKRAGLSHGYVHGVLIDGKDPTVERFLAVCAAIPMDPVPLIVAMQSEPTP